MTDLEKLVDTTRNEVTDLGKRLTKLDEKLDALYEMLTDSSDLLDFDDKDDEDASEMLRYVQKIVIYHPKQLLTEEVESCIYDCLEAGYSFAEMGIEDLDTITRIACDLLNIE